MWSKQSILKLIVTFIIILFCPLTLAAQGEFPRGCKNIGYKFEDKFLVLQPLKVESMQTIYLIQNKGKFKLLLEYKEPNDVLLHPNWKSLIAPKQWSAFATDRQNTQFACHNLKSKNNLEIIDCSKFLKICQYPRAKFALSNRGNYWIAHSKTQREAIRSAIKKGILLRW